MHGWNSIARPVAGDTAWHFAGTIADVWADERAALMTLPAAFDGFVEQSKRVSPTCLITFERNRYSVPASFANRPVSLRIYPERLVVAAEGNILCEHPRIIERSHDKPPRTIYDWRHYLAVIQRKPGALRNGAPFLELPLAFRRLQDQMLRAPGGDREMVDILALVLHHDEQVVLRAVELALEAGVVTKTHVLNLLHRLIDVKTLTVPTSTRHRRWPCCANPRPTSSAMTVYVSGSWEVVMRHDPASAAVVIMLRSLKMYGMAQAVTDLIEQGAPAFDAAVPTLSQLLKAEMASARFARLPIT